MKEFLILVSLMGYPKWGSRTSYSCANGQCQQVTTTYIIPAEQVVEQVAPPVQKETNPILDIMNNNKIVASYNIDESLARNCWR